MAIFGGLIGAKVGAVIGGLLLGPVGVVVGAKLGALAGSGGNPLSMVGLDLEGVDALDGGGGNGGPSSGGGEDVPRHTGNGWWG